MIPVKSFRAVLLLLILPLSSPAAVAADRVTGAAFATRSEVIAPHGMAATSHPLATQIALDILRRGGSAVDAAIAANAALGLMEPTGNGIGGDLFAIVWDAESGKLHGLNASGRARRIAPPARVQSPKRPRPPVPADPGRKAARSACRSTCSTVKTARAASPLPWAAP
mgnify:CR=1 FL=1